LGGDNGKGGEKRKALIIKTTIAGPQDQKKRVFQGERLNSGSFEDH